MTPADLGNYDWLEVFASAGVEKGENPGTPTAVLQDSVSCAPFGIKDVAEVLASSDGENDGNPWIIVVRLQDGRFAYLEGWCDYTGWDCRSGASATVASTLADLVQYGLTDEVRARLGLASV